MTPTKTSSAAPVADPVSELLEQRARLESWLEKLESEGSGANARVVERVRADYSGRLRAILDKLGEHEEALRADRASLEERLREGERRQDEATEALEEAQLRHRIGELSEEEWSDREPALTEAVDSAREEREAARAELERLDTLLAQIGNASPTGNGATAAPEAPSSEAEEEQRDEALTDPLSDLDEAGTIEEGLELEAEREELTLEEGETLADGAGAPDPLAFLAELPGSGEEAEAEPKANDLDFLIELDRAIAGSDSGEATAAAAEGDATAAAPGTPAEEDPEQYRPTPGTKCPECGYTNDPDAWYCGVCGVDLA